MRKTSAPRLGKGFLLGCEEARATERLVVVHSGEAHSLGHDVEAVALPELLLRLAADTSVRRG